MSSPYQTHLVQSVTTDAPTINLEELIKIV